ncbi:hypothetical protein BKA56DRAFT_592420 [Ilyonectria sp. MPI-CAGE-AT-0026]|nr:hypothetical protein BKA56DRAFT_592420 [Ilyonectria sp. MPI-CAGE-AT-0026]
MPPIRTAKNNTGADAQAPATNLPKMWLKALPEGMEEARFDSSERDWYGKYESVIGTSTRNIVFGHSFVLTDDHIDDILALGRSICKNITHFIFIYSDVSCRAQNNAQSLTSDAVVRLAKACPSLKKVKLQATSRVTDDGLRGLLEKCPNLISVEVTGVSGSGGNRISGMLLDELREKPEWAPKLRNLILGEREDNKVFMKAMRALTKERTELIVTLLQRDEVNKCGDWDLEEKKAHYKNGRLRSRW